MKQESAEGIAESLIIAQLINNLSQKRTNTPRSGGAVCGGYGVKNQHTYQNE